MLKKDILFSTKAFAWPSGGKKKRPVKKKLCFSRDGVSLGKDYFPYLELVNFRIAEKKYVCWEHDGLLYKWARLCGISGSEDGSLTGLLALAVSDAQKGN